MQLLFTCDEEIGHGADHIDLEQVGAIVGYTLDGGGEGDLDVETFSADGALVTFTGHNIHPSIGKGRMINAVRAASEFVSRLPRHVLAPEATDGTQGFIHPYEIKGGVGQAHVRLILRSFQTSDLEDYARLIKGVAEEVARLFPGSSKKSKCSGSIEISPTACVICRKLWIMPNKRSSIWGEVVAARARSWWHRWFAAYGERVADTEFIQRST